MKFSNLYLCCLLGLGGGLLLPGTAVFAEEAVEFDRAFLMGENSNDIDVQRFRDGNPVSPGRYRTQIYINNVYYGPSTLDFVDVNGNTAAVCITSKTLAKLQIKIPDSISAPESTLLKRPEAEEGDCLNMLSLYPQSAVNYSSGDLRLDLSIPQIWLEKKYDNYVPPALWEDGINAGMLSYNLNGYRTTSKTNTDRDSFYAGLNGGLNLLGWHFRARGNLSWDNKTGSSGMQYQNRYAQRDIPLLRSQLRIGESYTTGETFDSASIRGVRLYSDDRMLPPLLTGYAPVIKGVARTNAKVTVEQGGYKIYETTVAPGPFALDDISPSGYGSDIHVTVEEADGSVRTFNVPFSSVVQMLRPGISRWDISVGEINQQGLGANPGLVQATLYHGLNNLFTGYSGVQATDNHYLAGLLGIAMNTGIGAFALDVTHSQVDVPDDGRYSGQSYRLTYNKLVTTSNTSVNVAAYRYSTKNYMGLNDAISLIDNVERDKRNAEGEKYSINNSGRMRSQITLNVSQPLMIDGLDRGSFYLNASWRDFWHDSGTQKDFSVGYSHGAFWGSYSINLMRTYDENNRKDDQLFVNFSIPMEVLFGGPTRQSGFRSLDASLSTDFKGRDQLMLSSNGNTEDFMTSWNVNSSSASYSGSRPVQTVGGSLNHESPWGTWAGSLSADSEHNYQYSLNTDGGFIVHSGGMTFTNDSFSDTDTIALVKAPGAQGARVNYGANRIDRFGYAISSSMTPYRENRIALDVATLEKDVEINGSSNTSVPRYGAITLVNFETNEGQSAIVNLRRSDGGTLPLGAEVYDETNTVLGYVGQASQAFVRGIKNRGQLRVNWGLQAEQSCLATYQVPETPITISKSVFLDNVICRVNATSSVENRK